MLILTRIGGAISALAMLIASAPQLPNGDLEAPSTKTERLRIDDVQIVGTHNSYEPGMSPAEERRFKESEGQAAFDRLDYGFPPLTKQLDAGVRSLEIDLWLDPKGGLFAAPLLRKHMAAEGAQLDPWNDAAALAKPGIKVFHRPNDLYRSHCPTFIECLSQIKTWSDNHPHHVPIILFIDVKEEFTRSARYGGDADYRQSLLWNTPAVALIDREIDAVMPRAKLFTPDDLRGKYETLRDAARADAWPRLDNARGKIIFAMFESDWTDRGGVKSPDQYYRNGNDRLTGRRMFVLARDPAAPYAAFVNVTDKNMPVEAMAALVRQHYILRTRADLDTREARTNETARRNKAFAGGAQVVITDFYWPRASVNPTYSVRLPNGVVARCSPASARCGDQHP